MAQLSRPYQIGLAAVAVLAAAWLLLIQGHHETSTGSSASAPSASHVSTTSEHTVTASAAPARKATGNAGTATGGGSASSLGGLGHAIEKARGAVATSKADEHKLAERSAQASSPTSSSSSSETKATAPTTQTAKAPTTTAKKTTAPTHATTKSSSSTKSTTPGVAHRNTSTVRQHTVEAQLAQGKIAVILFWDPKGADDRSVHGALRSLRGQKGLKIAIDEAAAGQVASFGSITRGVQVYGTPTIMIVNKKGRAMTLTGLQDAYAIAQAVREVRTSS